MLSTGDNTPAFDHQALAVALTKGIRRNDKSTGSATDNYQDRFILVTASVFKVGGSLGCMT